MAVKSRAWHTRCEELRPLALNCSHHHKSKLKNYQEINYFQPNQAKFLPAVSVDYIIFKTESGNGIKANVLNFQTVCKTSNIHI